MRRRSGRLREVHERRIHYGSPNAGCGGYHAGCGLAMGIFAAAAEAAPAPRWPC